jgi:two-component system OmpR family response regulator
MAVNRLKVLCVDDNRDVADSDAMLLDLLGYHTHTCYDGQQAVVEEDRFCPDVCLLDLDMPGMSGCEVAVALRSRKDRRTPFLVAITAKGSQDDFHRTREAGFDAHLVKPVEPNRLIEMLAARKAA